MVGCKKGELRKCMRELTKGMYYNMLLLDFLLGRDYDFKKNGSSFF